MKRILPQSFFNRNSQDVARDLLSMHIVRKLRGKTIVVRITEVEIYDGFKDRASHAYRGETSRTKIMFGPPGYWYVYLVYGMHWMLNVVTREKGYPAAILIRGVYIKSENLYVHGPGKVTQILGITGAVNGKSTQRKDALWVEDRGASKQSTIIATRRIGIDYAGKHWASRRLRFILRKKK